MNVKSLLFYGFIAMAVIACNSEQEVTSTTNDYYKEQHRPQFHFSPEEQWMNDPNGMVYYEGEYHLFYQYYPDSNVWGPMHWGHAVSEDLVHWEHLPIALYPDSLGLIFSGSAVVDWENTSGLGENNQPPLIAIYTYHDMEGERTGRNDFQTQGIAFSNDKGRTWTKYKGNPVIPNSENIRDFRDPKVFWHQPTQKWVMIFAMGDKIRLYNSPNLIDWEVASNFGLGLGSQGRPWECPDLFELKIEGTDETRWVMIVSIGSGQPNGGSGTQYFIGDFDGKTFTIDPTLNPNYAKSAAVVPTGIVFEDFENGYGEWEITGDAFGEEPVAGAFSNQRQIENYSGQKLVNSFKNGDVTTGTLTSRSFTINSNFINFQIGGGAHEGKTCMNLLVDGEIVKTKSGINDENVVWSSWNVESLKGKKAVLQIVDNEKGGWGHVNVDQIIFANQPAIPVKDNTLWLDYGRDNYAGVTWSDIPKEDGRRLFLGWMSNWQYATIVPTYKWRSAMTIPRVLELRNTNEGLRVFSNPVKEMAHLVEEPLNIENQSLTESLDISESLKGALSHLETEFSWDEADAPKEFGVKLSNPKGEYVKVGFDVSNNQLFIDRTHSGDLSFSENFAKKIHIAPRDYKSNTLSISMFNDVASTEVFADEGRITMTENFFPSEDFNILEIYVVGGSVNIKDTKLAEVKSIW